MRKEIIKRQTNTVSKLEDTLLSLLENKDLIEIKTRELCSIAKINLSISDNPCQGSRQL